MIENNFDRETLEKRMKILLMGLMVMLTAINYCSAMDLLAYKTNSKVIRDISDKDFERLYQSNVPVCVKDGASIKTVNKAFKQAGLKYADCSSSDKALRKQAKLGFKVIVLPMYSLSTKYAKQVNSIQ